MNSLLTLNIPLKDLALECAAIINISVIRDQVSVAASNFVFPVLPCCSWSLLAGQIDTITLWRWGSATVSFPTLEFLKTHRDTRKHNNTMSWHLGHPLLKKCSNSFKKQAKGEKVHRQHLSGYIALPMLIYHYPINSIHLRLSKYPISTNSNRLHKSRVSD